MTRAFSSLRWLCWVVALCASLSSPAHADVMQTYAYEPGKIYVVRTALGIATQITLVSDDEVVDYSVGFSGGWDVSRRGNVIYVRPKNVDVDTNLIVRTRERTYVIDLKVVASNWKRLDEAKRAGVQYRVLFVTQGLASTGTLAQSSSPGVVASAEMRAPEWDASKRYVFAYDVAASRGATALLPTNVYDDGSLTYVRLRNARGTTGLSQPAVFARRTQDGGDMTVNSHIDGNVVVVHGVYPFLALRNGAQLVLIRRNQTR
ncbi:TrbG/VirB9 family P-type conjugative transfer protein [Lysobacter sp. HDW10]|uniref:TrbG/VirB9 family P-type conjugative transfer protein n=1 Tax=Lysobacter sp. HDW10 TaxID=2714936 RepID=UPI00140AB3AF|nr:TrbG/VirB9 family P-type conjugative transfer protein [Lysobacter sp. HDW10]QIK81415.1 TrbG/VirB9 family P-type conjugative transfer protein [Lysobacter sp. HDW10]